MKRNGLEVSVIAAILSCGVAVAQSGSSPASASSSGPKDRGRVVSSGVLPRMDGDHLKTTLVEVTYGPGEASLPHSHSCPVTVYVLEGTVRTQVQGEPEAIYKAGESFTEAPNGIHLISANASKTAQARFIAFFVCDHDAPLSIPAGATTKGSR